MTARLTTDERRRIAPSVRRGHAFGSARLSPAVLTALNSGLVPSVRQEGRGW